MPQLKKLSVLPNGLLPKVEGLDSIFLTYSAQQDASSYLSLLTDMKSHLLSSEADSDGGDSLPSTKPRKRQRLDHLSQEEKIMRRKMKNRVAAQTARDRKKARMQELEEQVIDLETDKKMLMIANMELQAKNSILQKENEALKLRLGEECLNKSIKEESLSTTDGSESGESFAESRLSEVSSSLDHAEGTGSANSYTLDDAIRILTNNSESDDLFDILQQCSEDLLQCGDFSSPLSDFSETRDQETSASEVVGPTSKSLESNKELIHFDHIYYKQGDKLTSPEDPTLSLSDSDLCTNDTHIDIPMQVEPTPSLMPIESDDSTQIPMICVSNANNSTAVLHNFDENLVYSDFGDNMLTVTDIRPVPSPVSSDGGYDSSFSVGSPCSNATTNPWDDTLTELFPSLV